MPGNRALAGNDIKAALAAVVAIKHQVVYLQGGRCYAQSKCLSVNALCECVTGLGHLSSTQSRCTLPYLSYQLIHFITLPGQHIQFQHKNKCLF